jgi:hypothetical protein
MGCFDPWLPTCMALGRQTGLSLPCFPCYLLAWGACFLHARWGTSEPEEGISEEGSQGPSEPQE